MTEFTIHLANRPGQLAGLTKLMADAGVEIEALAAFGMEDIGIVRLVVGDAENARRAIDEAGLVAEQRRVVTTVLSHRPGALAALTQSLAEAGVNIDGLYVLHSRTDEVELALAVGDEEAARAAIA
ncbi:MAG: ACT domain-containing protein [Acidimicrobiia bacterium]|nr:ACT domain-containing protein [Acidimicrobiia bacterium]MBT8217810.1 ACT domain-containing protein [Acidimicrobiia bacterium]NNF08802.1 ACT domain-containing protein [Acidimicrobiia bacterium]NNL69111.1 ACT domain-containing protein [Acidimicrobiia bacterium]